MTTREEVLDRALALPVEDRLSLIESLECSFDPEEFASPHIARAWSEEIERRLTAFERGESGATDATVAMRDLRRQLQAARKSGDE